MSIRSCHVRDAFVWFRGFCQTIPGKGKEPLLLRVTMFGNKLRCLLFASLCLKDPYGFGGDQFVFEDEGTPVLRRFNFTSPAQLEKTLGKAQVRTPRVGVSDVLKITLGSELWSRCLARYPGPHRYLLPLQLDSIAHHATVRGLPDAQLPTPPSGRSNGLEYIVLRFRLPLLVSPAFGDPGLHFRPG